MSVISEPDRHNRSDGFLGAVGIGCVVMAGAIAIASGGDLDRDIRAQPPVEQEKTNALRDKPAHQSGKPFCTQVDSRAGVKVTAGDTISEIAEQEMPEIRNTNKAAAMVLAMNGINPADPTIHPGEIVTIPAEACAIQE